MSENERSRKSIIVNAVIIGLLATFVGWTIVLQQEVSDLKASLKAKTEAAFGTIGSIEASVKSNSVDVEVTREFQRSIILPLILPKIEGSGGNVDSEVMGDFLNKLKDLDKERHTPVEPLEGEKLHRYIEQRQMIQRPIKNAK